MTRPELETFERYKTDRSVDFSIDTITVTARDGYPLAATVFAPQAPTAAVLISSGTGFPQGFYRAFAEAGAARGVACLTYDYRGVAGSAPDDLAALDMAYADWGRHDMPAALDALKAVAPGLPIAHVGHSVGGHFLGFMDNHADIDRHVFVAVGSGYWRDHFLAYNPMELFFWFGLGPWSLAQHGYVKGGRLWRGVDLPRGVFEDWKRWCRQPAYFTEELKGALRPHDFEGVRAPITSVIYSDDPIANLKTAPVMLACYPNAPSEIVFRRPSDYGLKALGHEGVFRRANAAAWDELWALALLG